MTTPVEALLPGLRERKKRETRATVMRRALELFERKGFAATTIPEIAHTAGVSPRTVSSYFPAKEDLVFPDAIEVFDGLAARLADRAVGETTADVLRAWIVELDKQIEPDLEVLRRKVVDANEHLQAHGRGFMARGEELVAQAIATDLRCAPTDLEVRMASAATLAVFAVIGDERPVTCSDQREPASLAQVDRALVFVEAGIRALQRPVTD